MKFLCTSLTFVLILAQQAMAQLPGSGNAYDYTFNFAVVPHNAALSPTNAISIEAWIKADSWANNHWENVIVSKDGWQFGEEGYTLRAGDNGTLSFNFGTPGAWQEVTTGSVMIPGQWYHVAGTFDGQFLRAYINGIEEGSTAWSGTMSPGTYDLHIGRIAYTAGGTRDFDGTIDEVRLWNTAVSQSDLQDWMCRKSTSGHPNAANLMAYYNMDETTGTVLMDQGPNGLNGTFTGPTRVTSGAPIGDASVHTYSAPATLSLAWGSVDSVRVGLIGNTPTMHVYRVDDKANTVVVPAGVNAMDTTHYYGVFAPPTGSLAFEVTYYYGTNPLVAGALESDADLVQRVDNTGTWASASAALDVNADTLGKMYLQRVEFALALNDCQSSLIDFGTIDTVQCADGGDVTITNGFPSGGAYSGTGMSGNVFSPAIAGIGQHMLYYDGTDSVGCTGTDSVLVEVFAPPTVAQTSFSPACENDTPFTLTGGIPTGGQYSGPWVSNNVFDPAVAGPGGHVISYIYTDGNGCSDTAIATMTVYTNPAAPAISQNGATLCIPGSISSIVWVDANGTPISGATDSCYTTTADGMIGVLYISIDGCPSDTTWYNMTYFNVDEPAWASEVTIGPNPTNDIIHVTMNGSLQSLQANLYDAQGRVLLSKMLQEQQSVFNTSSLFPGVYFLMLADDSGHMVRRIIKQ